MIFQILFALICLATADVAHLDRRYLPPSHSTAFSSPHIGKYSSGSTLSLATPFSQKSSPSSSSFLSSSFGTQQLKSPSGIHNIKSSAYTSPFSSDSHLSNFKTTPGVDQIAISSFEPASAHPSAAITLPTSEQLKLPSSASAALSLSDYKTTSSFSPHDKPSGLSNYKTVPSALELSSDYKGYTKTNQYSSAFSGGATNPSRVNNYKNSAYTLKTNQLPLSFSSASSTPTSLKFQNYKDFPLGSPTSTSSAFDNYKSSPYRVATKPYSSSQSSAHFGQYKAFPTTIKANELSSSSSAVYSPLKTNELRYHYASPIKSSPLSELSSGYNTFSGYSLQPASQRGQLVKSSTLEEPTKFDSVDRTNYRNKFDRSYRKGAAVAKYSLSQPNDSKQYTSPFAETFESDVENTQDALSNSFAGYTDLDTQYAENGGYIY